MWEIWLTKSPEKRVLVLWMKHLSPTICRAVQYSHRDYQTWYLPEGIRGLFLEEYEAVTIHTESKLAIYWSKKLRRCGELPRHFDPARLPV